MSRHLSGSAECWSARNSTCEDDGEENFYAAKTLNHFEAGKYKHQLKFKSVSIRSAIAANVYIINVFGSLNIRLRAKCYQDDEAPIYNIINLFSF